MHNSLVQLIAKTHTSDITLSILEIAHPIIFFIFPIFYPTDFELKLPLRPQLTKLMRQLKLTDWELPQK